MAQLAALGFSEAQAQVALTKAGGNVEAAAEYLFTNAEVRLTVDFQSGERHTIVKIRRCVVDRPWTRAGHKNWEY